MADRVLVAVSHYYKHISEEMLAGAMEVLEAADAKVTVMEVPGAFEALRSPTHQCKVLIDLTR